MPKEDTIKIDGTVEELLPNMNFRVTLAKWHVSNRPLCGKMRMKNIRVLVGDVVTVEMSPYDLTKARIMYQAEIKIKKMRKGVDFNSLTDYTYML